MSHIKNLPLYYANPDNSHCFQCCLRMTLEHFTPAKSWTWEELCEMTGKEPGLHTWPTRIYAELQDSDYDSVIYDCFEYGAFSLNPETYLREKFSPEYAQEAITYSNIPAILKDVSRLLANKNIRMHRENYDAEDVKRLIEDGYLIIAWVDHAKIWKLENQCNPHYVLVYGYDDHGVIMHDPGGDEDTRQSALHVSWDAFFDANKMNAEGETGEMLAIRPKQISTEGGIS